MRASGREGTVALTGIVICLVGLLSSFVLGRLSLAAGLGSVITAGYLYGILRANFVDGATYFLFDASVTGLYLSWLGGLPAGARNPALAGLNRWTGVLIGWPVIMFLLPLQHPLIQLVGLRGNAFLLPFLLVGGWLRRHDARQVAVWLAVLNHVAFAFALAEFILGVPAFFPRNAATELIYRSQDVAGHTALRIPACFANAHSYGGAMVISLPWLIGVWMQPRVPLWQRALAASGIAVALGGVFMCAARQVVVQLAVVVLVTTLSGKMRGGAWIAWFVLLGGVAYVVSGEERLQRFVSLQDTDYVMTRIEGSVNLGFADLVVTYPLGNGMGAGGTSIPYFLQHLVHDPVGLENEYSRILLEQGLPGLLCWLAFIIWFVRRRPTLQDDDPWALGRLLLWVMGLISFATALIGTGLMTAIPQSTLFCLGVGFCVTPHLPAVRRRRRRRAAAAPPGPPAPAALAAPGPAPSLDHAAAHHG